MGFFAAKPPSIPGQSLVLELTLRGGEWGDADDRKLVAALAEACNEQLKKIGARLQDEEYGSGKAVLRVRCREADVAWQAMRPVVLKARSLLPLRVSLNYGVSEEEAAVRTAAVRKR